MDFIEEFARNNQYTIQALVALGTWVAVGISLLLSRGKFKSKLLVSLDVARPMAGDSFYHSNDPKDIRSMRAVVITIKNIGLTTVYLSKASFRWRLPWPKAGKGLVFPITFDERHSKLEAGEEHVYALNFDSVGFCKFVDEMVHRARMPMVLRRLAWFETRTQDGSSFKAVLAPGIRYQLNNWREL